MDTAEKIKLIRKLVKAGYKEETEIQNIDLCAVIATDAVKFSDLYEIFRLIEACKKNALIEWLLS